jgi:hypothetical protein
MSNTKAESTSFAFSTNKSNIGMINVPDDRLNELAKLVNPLKVVPATVEVVDIPGLAKGSSKGEGVGNSFLSDIRNADALIHVLRCFDDDNLPHIDGSVNPVRDLETIDLELQVKDLESVEKKIQRLEKVAKSGDKEAKKGIEVLHIYKQHLESFENARTAPVKEEDKKHVEDLFLLSVKPVMYVCNVDEASAVKGNKHVEAVKKVLAGKDAEILVIAGAMEADIAELDDENDRKEFLDDIGLSEPGVNKLIRSAYKMLNLMSFFTAGPKEVKAWTIRRGSTAPEAAGAIHSDLQRGFIRAEVMKYDDFVELKSEAACRDVGKFYIEGKNYIVEEGDILHVRFNV